MWLGRTFRHDGGGGHAPDYTAAMSAPAASSATASVPAPVPVASRVAALSYFFPAHNEAENIEALVDEALEALPALADAFEIIAVDDGSKDGTAAIADRLAAEHPGVVRVVHHAGQPRLRRCPAERLRGRVATRSSPSPTATASSASPTWRRLLARAEARRPPDVVVGYRLRRADPTIRLVYARAYRFCLRLFFGLPVRDVDCACKLFRREALEGIRLESGGAFLSAELLIKVRARGRQHRSRSACPHYPRTAGQASGADPRVVLRAVRDFWRLRLRLWFRRAAAHCERGEPVARLGRRRQPARRAAPGLVRRAS